MLVWNRQCRYMEIILVCARKHLFSWNQKAENFWMSKNMKIKNEKKTKKWKSKGKKRKSKICGSWLGDGNALQKKEFTKGEHDIKFGD